MAFLEERGDFQPPRKNNNRPIVGTVENNLISKTQRATIGNLAAITNYNSTQTLSIEYFILNDRNFTFTRTRYELERKTGTEFIFGPGRQRSRKDYSDSFIGNLPTNKVLELGPKLLKIRDSNLKMGLDVPGNRDETYGDLVPVEIDNRLQLSKKYVTNHLPFTTGRLMIECHLKLVFYMRHLRLSRRVM